MDLIFESESKLHKILVSIKFIFIVNIIKQIFRFPTVDILINKGCRYVLY